MENAHSGSAAAPDDGPRESRNTAAEAAHTASGAPPFGPAGSQSTAGNAPSTSAPAEEGQNASAPVRRDDEGRPPIAAKSAPPSMERPPNDRGHSEPGAQVDPEGAWNAAPPPAGRESQPAVSVPEANAARPAELAPPEATAQPVSRDVSLRMAEGETSVDIRMAERAGEIRVTVHTPDRELANSLRLDLPELVGRLRQSGFDAEAWRPGIQSDTVRRSGSNGFARQEDAPGSRRDGRQQQPQQQQSKDPSRWTGEWQSSLTFTQESLT